MKKLGVVDGSNLCGKQVKETPQLRGPRTRVAVAAVKEAHPCAVD